MPALTRPLPLPFAFPFLFLFLASWAPSGCAHVPPLIAAGDEMTGSGQARAEPRAAPTTKPVLRDRPLTLLGTRVTFAAAPAWIIEKQEYTRSRGFVELSVPLPPSARASQRARATVTAELVAPTTNLRELGDAVARQGSVLSDSPDGADWRTVVWSAVDGSALHLVRLGLVNGLRVEFAVEFTVWPGAEKWIAGVVRDFNRLSRQLAVDGQSHCEVIVTIDAAK